jgi:hypothetical protein
MGDITSFASHRTLNPQQKPKPLFNAHAIDHDLFQLDILFYLVTIDALP